MADRVLAFALAVVTGVLLGLAISWLVRRWENLYGTEDE